MLFRAIPRQDVKPLARALREHVLGEGGSPQASLLGGPPERATLRQAALANGTAGHALDYDDTLQALYGHPSAPVVPAALALAEWRGSPGRALLGAIAAGVEVEARMGRLAGEAHYEAGFHATGTLGTFGAAAAAGRLLGLDEEAMAHALGLAATGAAGLKGLFGTMGKPLHAGRAAATGLESALLAWRGFRSRPDAIECPRGFAEVLCPAPDFAGALAGPERGLEIEGTRFKYHAACYGTHPVIEAVREIVGRSEVLPLASGQATDPEALVLDPSGGGLPVRSVEARVHHRTLAMCDIVRPRTGLEMKFSMRMAAALALAGVDTARLDVWTDGWAAHPGLQALAERVRIERDDGLARDTARVIVTLVDGTRLEALGDVARPDPDLARERGRLGAKLVSLVGPLTGPSRAEALLEAIERVHELPEVGTLVAGATLPSGRGLP